MEVLPNELWDKIIPIALYDRKSTHLVCQNWLNLAITKIKYKYKDFLNHRKLFNITLKEISSIQYQLTEEFTDESRCISLDDTLNYNEVKYKLRKYISIRQYKNKATYTRIIHEDYIDIPVNSNYIYDNDSEINIITNYYEYINYAALSKYLKVVNSTNSKPKLRIIHRGPYYKFDTSLNSPFGIIVCNKNIGMIVNHRVCKFIDYGEHIWYNT